MSKLSLVSADETVLTTEQAAAYLNIPAKRMDYWRWTGCGPTYFRIGKSPRYTRTALNDYIQGRAVVSVNSAL